MAIAASSSVRVLCVDDEPGLADLAGSYLERAHEAIVSVSQDRVDEAVAHFDDSRFDAIISDFDMPEMTGLEFLEVVRETDPAIPFILYTGKGSEEIASEAISKGVTEYMQKQTDPDHYSVLANRVLNAVEQYRTERELEEERARFQSVFEQASDAMIIAEDDGSYVNVNSAACELFGRSEEELLGKTPADFTYTDFDFDTNWESFKEVKEERGLYPVEQPDGTVIVAEYAASADILPGKHLSVLRDITERREYERKLSLQKERLSEFAGVLSHDLRNPTQVAKGHIDILSNGTDADEWEQHQEAAFNAITRIDHVINDVLAISQEDGASRESTEVALSDMAEDVWQRVNPHGKDPQIEQDIVVSADEDRLERLVTNLFRNVIEHGDKSAIVAMGTLTERDGFYIEDDGPGIASEARDQVFEWQHSTKDGGTGIGLKSVKQITEAEGWSVKITDGSLGGARFEFSTEAGS